MRIYDTWIDFVNLRSETYAENSRIPTMVPPCVLHTFNWIMFIFYLFELVFTW